MNYKIEILSDLEIVKVTVDGPIDILEKKDFYSKALKELYHHDYSRLLFDTGRGVESEKRTLGDSIDMFNYIEKPQSKEIKLAFLTRDANDLHRSFGVILEAITNIEGRHFTSEDEAIAWLCEE